MSYIKDPNCWSGQVLNQQPPAQQTGAISIILIVFMFFHLNIMYDVTERSRSSSPTTAKDRYTSWSQRA